jgi:hypothetical protein
MNYLLWKTDTRPDAPSPRPELRESGVLRGLRLTSAGPLKQPFPHVVIDLLGPKADYFKIGPMRVVSDRLAAIVRASVGKGVVEFHPVQVMRGVKALEDGYFCMHVIREVDALDWKKADYVPLKDWADELQQVVLMPAKTKGNKLFWLARVTAPALLVRSDLAEEILSAGLTGASFVPVA